MPYHKYRMTPVLLLAATTFASAALHAESTGPAGAAQARELVQQFAGTLKPILQGAMQAGGPVNAIDVCAEQAPQIADRLSEQSGWEVRRVSLKPRNAERAQPDEWEREQLADFNRRREAGENPMQINHGETVDGRYRYLQAQGVEEVCLHCHGQQVAEPVAAAIAKYYPDDTATGYSAGQIRGAISLVAPAQD